MDTNQSITCFENLSNELFYDICDYLDGIDLYHAFSNLNSHYHQLLKSSCLFYKIKHSDLTSNDRFLNLWNQITSFHQQQIFSLDIWLSSNLDQFYLSSFLLDASFNHLQSITINELTLDTLLINLKKLSSLPHLFSLTINMSYEVHDLTQIYQLVFRLPVLKYYKFVTFDENLPVSLPRATNQFSSIEHLVIDHCCTFNELSILTSYTPKLHHLKFTQDSYDKTMKKNFSPIILPNLTYLSIHDYYSTFNQLKNFLLKFNANIKTVRFITQSENQTYFNDQRWERFLLESFSQIETFYFEYREYIRDDTTFPVYTGQLNPFTSSFWSEKQWLFYIEIDYDFIKYIVCPYKKRWFDYTNEHIEYSKLHLLKIEDIPSMQSFESLSKCIQHCLEIEQIYHLEISLSQITIVSLIRILNVLPELQSLKLSLLAYVEITETDNEELLYFQTSINRKKLTKIYVQHMFLMNEIFFIMDLFPCMSHFKLDCLYNVDVQTCLHDLLIGMKEKSLDQYLRSVCFGVSTTDDEFIESLRKTIDDEQLLTDYTIKRATNQIYIEWK